MPPTPDRRRRPIDPWLLRSRDEATGTTSYPQTVRLNLTDTIPAGSSVEFRILPPQ